MIYGNDARSTGSRMETTYGRSSPRSAKVESLADLEPASDTNGDGTLGRGSFGSVRKVKKSGTSKIYALKSIRKAEVIAGQMTDQVEREIQVQRSLKHENILRLYQHFEDENNVYLLLEYCTKGELYQLMRTTEGRKFSGPTACRYFVQVCKGLQYLHRYGIVHRDLKPENLLVNDADVVKIADFGWCARLNCLSSARNTFCGTLDYLAPEMINARGHDEKLDVWGLGVLLFEMLVGKPPFQSPNHGQLILKILNISVAAVIDEHPTLVPHTARGLILRLLVREPAKRLSIAEAIAHEWVQNEGKPCRPSIRDREAFEHIGLGEMPNSYGRKTTSTCTGGLSSGSNDIKFACFAPAIGLPPTPALQTRFLQSACSPILPPRRIEPVPECAWGINAPRVCAPAPWIPGPRQKMETVDIPATPTQQTRFMRTAFSPVLQPRRIEPAESRGWTQNSHYPQAPNTVPSQWRSPLIGTNGIQECIPMLKLPTSPRMQMRPVCAPSSPPRPYRGMNVCASATQPVAAVRQFFTPVPTAFQLASSAQTPLLGCRLIGTAWNSNHHPNFIRMPGQSSVAPASPICSSVLQSNHSGAPTVAASPFVLNRILPAPVNLRHPNFMLRSQ